MTSPAHTSMAQRIHAVLPQTQCTRCGFPDCMAYAQAIAERGAAINQCPPGGTEGIARLAEITGLPAVDMNLANGAETVRSVAVIDENWCIGCTLCLPVCPTDAILGSNKKMHTVIEPHCTGCELCIAVCPVDCISLENVTGKLTGWQAWSQAQADHALNRYIIHSLKRSGFDAVGTTDSATPGLAPKSTGPEQKQLAIQAAIKRSRDLRTT